MKSWAQEIYEGHETATKLRRVKKLAVKKETARIQKETVRILRGLASQNLKNGVSPEIVNTLAKAAEALLAKVAS